MNKSFFTDVKDDTSLFNKKEIKDGKLMSIISYLGILVIIPFILNKDNRFVSYNAKQGMNLLLVDIICGLFIQFMNRRLISYFISPITILIDLMILSFVAIGIMNVCLGKAKEIPLLCKIKIIK